MFTNRLENSAEIDQLREDIPAFLDSEFALRGNEEQCTVLSRL